MFTKALAVAALSISGAAQAVPSVSFQTGATAVWDLFWLAQTDKWTLEPRNFVFGEYSGWGESPNFEQWVGEVGQRSSAGSFGTFQSSTFTGDGYLSHTFSVGLALELSVDPNLPEAAQAYGVSRARSIYALMDVLEPVMYTGNFALTAGNETYRAGDIIGPGNYFINQSVNSEELRATVYSGESLSLSKVYDRQLVFTSVPTPTALPLIAIGLFGMMWHRSRGRTRQATPTSNCR